MHTTRQPRALARHEQAPCPCLRSACHRPSPARQRSTRRQRRERLQGQPARRCLASLRVRARASRRSGADRSATGWAAWPCREQSAAALAAHRSAPWGGGWVRQGAAAVGARCRAHGGQEAAPPAASGSRRRRLQREDGAYRSSHHPQRGTSGKKNTLTLDYGPGFRMHVDECKTDRPKKPARRPMP